MSRLLVHVEGQTEETFVNEVLSAYLIEVGYQSVSARIIGNARLRQRRGGIRPWPVVRRDIINHLHQDPGCTATTMVDFYGLPATGEGAWPGRNQAVGMDSGQKALLVHAALLEDVAHAMGQEFDRRRFVPFVVMHEFEGLLFSDCTAFASAIGHTALEPQLLQIRNGFPCPEDINDSPATCPSRRVMNLVPKYEKPLFGSIAAIEIGLGRMRQYCPTFNNWIERLESLI